MSKNSLRPVKARTIAAAQIHDAWEILDITYEGLTRDENKENSGHARRLLYEARDLLGDVEERVRTDGDLNEAMGDIDLAVAMVLGARDMRDVQRALPLMVRDVPAALDSVRDMLDRAAVDLYHEERAAQATTTT